MSPSDSVRLTTFFSLILLVLTLHADCAESTASTVTESLPLSLEEGKILLLQQNLDIAIQEIAPRIEDERLQGEEGVFDPLLSASFKRGDSTSPLSTRPSVAAGGRNVVESRADHFEGGLSGKIPPGTEYSLNFQDTRTENSFNNFDAEYNAFAGITVVQPLLKNFGSDVNQFEIIIAHKSSAISRQELKESLTSVIADYVKAYWDLVLAREDIEVVQESLQLAESLLDQNRKKLRAEIISPLEVIQAEAGVAERKEVLIATANRTRERENALKRLISRDLYRLRDVRLIPTDAPTVKPFTDDLEDSYAIGLENRPDYQMEKIELQKRDITVKYAKNQKLPTLDLEASYGYNGLGRSFEESVHDLDNNREWTVGMVVTFPLRNRSARADLMVARLEAERSLLNLKKIEQTILVEIDNAIRDVRTGREQIEAAGITKDLAAQSLRAEQRKLDEGLSTTYDVLQFQEDLTRARFREIQAIINYNKSLVELSRLKGTLLQEQGIILEGDARSQHPLTEAVADRDGLPASMDDKSVVK